MTKTVVSRREHRRHRRTSGPSGELEVRDRSVSRRTNEKNRSITSRYSRSVCRGSSKAFQTVIVVSIYSWVVFDSNMKVLTTRTPGVKEVSTWTNRGKGGVCPFSSLPYGSPSFHTFPVYESEQYH